MAAPKAVLNFETRILACKVAKTVYCRFDGHANLFNSQAAGGFKRGPLLSPALWIYMTIERFGHYLPNVTPQ